MVFKLLYLKKERVNVSTILISIQLSQQLSFEQLQKKKKKTSKNSSTLLPTYKFKLSSYKEEKIKFNSPLSWNS